MRRFLLLLLLLFLACAGLMAIAASHASAQIPNEDCMACHADTTLEGTRGGRTVRMGVRPEDLDASVHAGFGCADCHADATEIPHPDSLARVDCATCHADAQAAWTGSAHGQAMAAGDPDAAACADCHGSHRILPSSDEASSVHPIRVVQTCAHCHADPDMVQRHFNGRTAPIDAYLNSVHGRALLVEGNPSAPTCSVCHPAHEMLRATDPQSLVNRMNIPSTCGMCHSDISDVYIESVHGTAAMRGVADAPVCTDCHGEHEIRAPEDPLSTVFPARLAETTCMRCHASEILGQRYGFSADRVATFRETYHGLASEKGALDVANCASCHGVHNIFPSSDPRSTIHPANLQATCGDCHPDASQAFATIDVHPEITGGEGILRGETPRQVAKSIYVVLLIVVIGGMVLHNLIIWIYHAVEKVRRERQVARVRRWTRFEVVEHLVFFISFFLLVLTGFALRFPDAAWVNLTERLGMTEAVRGIVHRVAAVVMIAISIAHLGFMVGTRRGRRDLSILMPKIRDFQDFGRNMAYHLRLSKQRPTFPRFDYTEKLEYLALIWGTLVMVATGFVLWFPTFFTRYFPGWIFEVSEVVHYYEAWLAFLSILIWHFFYVFFHPDVQPMNPSWLDGMVPLEHAIHKHGGLEPGEEVVLPETRTRERKPEEDRER